MTILNISTNMTTKISNIAGVRNILEIFDYLYGCEFFVGMLLNALTIITCSSKPLRRTPSFIVVNFISLANVIILAMVALPKFLNQLISSSFYLNLVWCKIALFFQIFSNNWAAWLVVKYFS